MYITIQQIEAFISVAEHLNLTEAAGEMFISHSALSKVITRFESNLGVTLFTRKNRGLSLTAEGLRLFDAIRGPYRGVLDALQSAANSSKDRKPLLRLGFPDSYNYNLSYDIVKGIVAQYRLEYPDTEIVESIFESDDLLLSLVAKETDIIFGQSFIIEQLRDVSMMSIVTSDTYVVVSQKHPLAANDELAFSQMESEVLYAVQNGERADMERKLDAMCKALGFRPKDIRLVPNTPTLLHVINAGKGIAFFAKVDNTTADMALRFLPFPKGAQVAKWSIVAAWFPRHESREKDCFLEILRDATV